MKNQIISLLHRSNIYGIDQNDLHLQLLSNSEYPSLKAITDTLDYFGVENITANVPKDVLSQLPATFLAIIEENEQSELVLVSVKKEKVSLKKQGNKKAEITRDHFLTIWTGTIIAIEKADKKEFSGLLKLLQVEFVLFAGLIMSLVLLHVFTNTSWVATIQMLLAVFGIITSYLIAKEELGIKDQRMTKLCNSLSRTGEGCSATINSKEMGVLNRIPLKNISMIYFSSILIVLAVLGTHISSLFLLSIIAIPVVLLTLYAQAFIIKKWCLLCLIISLIVGSQFGLMLYAFSGWDFSLSYFLYAGIIFLWVSFGWYQIKKLWTDRIQLKTTRMEYYRFKRNRHLFFNALYKGTPVNTSLLDSLDTISFGNKNAKIQMLAITNPLCGYCSEPFKTYAQLMDRYPDDIRISIVFNVSSNEENTGTQVALQMVDLYKKNKARALTSIIEWFKERDLNSWQEKYDQGPMSISPNSRQVINIHRSWCAKNEIHYTPKTIVNNHHFPKDPYVVDDLLFFIDDLLLEPTKNEVVMT